MAKKRMILRKKKAPMRRKIKRARVTKLVRAVGLPKCIYTKLNFHKIENLTLAGGANSYWEYNINNLYDPEAALSTGQPYYFDQYTAMYSRYRVSGCKLEAIISATCSTTNLYHPTIVLAPYADELPGWSNHTNMMNAKRAVKRIVIPGQNVVRLKQYYYLPSVAGCSVREYHSDDKYQARVTTNPSYMLRAQINLLNNDVSAAVSFLCVTKLTFYCKFFDEREPTPS